MSDQKRAQAEIERLRNEFLGIVSHELKTPLTAIKGSAAIVLSGRILPPDDEVRDLFEVIDNQAERLRELVSNLLDLTRIEAGTFSVEIEETAVDPMIAELQSTLRKIGDPHPLEIRSPAGLPPVLADRRRIVQVMMNLVNNAAKFSPPESPIVVSVAPEEPEIVVKVIDFGAGIPADKLPRLFEKFTQFHAKGRGGSGLGLPIAKGIVEAHGGRIWAESGGEGKGSAFTFTLPVAAAVPEEAVAVPEQFAVTPVHRATILVVDDEPDILRYIGHCLVEAGFEPVLADEPLQVKKLVKSMKPDAVLLDLRLPGTAGLDLLKELREFSSAPVIFITGSEDPEIERVRTDMGPLDRLGKPFSPEELLSKLAIVLKQQPARDKER
jgi:CheY-like chemotaxis protein